MNAPIAGEPVFGVGPDGWLAGARAVPSPFFDARPPGCAVELIVIHCISLPPGCFGTGQVERLFTGRLEPSEHPFFERLRGLRLSSHFFIERDGGLVQFVACGQRAWHAGRSLWEGRGACNDFSLGIELEGTEFEAFTAPQYATLAALHGALCAAFPIRATRGHDEIAPGRKADPGPLFDWRRIPRETGRASNSQPKM